ncbi:hypothetical protein GOP47_0014457 [Adiantum capillus-veneris]|uniref:Uncharacterized protein n=1 Tax=Adiantum capillus-veneris TaxID=13818 RepID=A0A9D4ULI7_ADICA|nr:hypothetical protein GOP47_0014457 [Adiantum capillus-veneris]
MRAMQGSAGEESYAKNSWAQNYNFHFVAKPRLEKALKHLVLSARAAAANESIGRPEAVIHQTVGRPPADADDDVVPRRHHIAIADLGCSYGRNTLDCANFVLQTLRKTCTTSLHSSPLEIQYFFSDLPSNDFNSLFQSLQHTLQSTFAIDDELADHPPPIVFAAGVPGSFYGRLFPLASVDLAICSYSLHWLSQIPPSIIDRTSIAWNGARTWISKDKSSKNVRDAYAKQSKIDVNNFLKSRAHELSKGGMLFLFSIVRSTMDLEDKLGQGTSDLVPIASTFEVLDLAWNELVHEGLVTLEEKEMFNIPVYLFNQQELEEALKDVPDLRVLQMETIKNVPVFPNQGDQMQIAEQWLAMFATTLKLTVEAHMGKTKANALFEKLKSIAVQQSHYFGFGLCHNILIASLIRS